MPKLILKEKGKESEKVFNFEYEEISLGRTEINSVVLDNSTISRKHAKIFPDGNDFYIVDMGSLSGTKVNGIIIPKDEKFILKHNDIISIENFDIRFQLIDEMLNQSFNEITDSDILEVKLLKKVLRALDRESIPSVEVLNGAAEGKKAFITDDISEITIGRDPMCEFQIEEYVISRRHAKIMKKWGGIIIQDLNSKNGVYVNNRRVAEEFLHDGDRIALGTIVLMFRNPREIDLEAIGQQMTKDKKAAPEKESKEPPPEAISKDKEKPDDDEMSSSAEALPEEEQKKLVEDVKKKEYPIPHTKRQRIKFSAMELSFMGLGILVFLFAIVMIVNLIFS